MLLFKYYVQRHYCYYNLSRSSDDPQPVQKVHDMIIIMRHSQSPRLGSARRHRKQPAKQTCKYINISVGVRLLLALLLYR